MKKRNRRSITAFVNNKSFTIPIRKKDTAKMIAEKLNRAVNKEIFGVMLFSASSAVKKVCRYPCSSVAKEVLTL